MAQFLLAKGTNPAYMLTLACATANLEIVADLPEQTVLALQSNWEARMPGASVQQAARDNEFTNMAGISPLSQEWGTRQMWVDTTPLEFSFHLLLDAQTSAYQDVFLPAVNILELVAPESWGDWLLPPGPSRIHKTKNAIMLAIGKMIRIDDGIIVAAQPTFDNRMDAQGYPIACDLEITIRTSVTYSRTNIKNMVQTPSS